MKREIRLITLFFLFTLLHSQVQFENNRDRYCEGVEIEIEITENQFVDTLGLRDNLFFNKFNEIITFYQNNDIGQLFAAILPYAILIFIWGFCLLVTVLVFLALLFGQFKKENANIPLFTTLGCSSLLLFICAFVGFILFFIFSSIAQKRSFCSTYDFPTTTLFGSQDDSNQFMGFKNMQKLISDFNDELPFINKLDLVFKQVHNSDVVSQTNKAWASLDSIYKEYKDKEIQNGDGLWGRPGTLKRMEFGIDRQISTEFTQLDTTADKFVEAINEGFFFQNNIEVAQTRAINRDIIENLDQINDKMTKFFEKVVESAEKAYEYATTGYIVLLVMGIISLILMSIILMILCLYCTREMCIDCNYAPKLMLLFLAFIIFVSSLVTFSLLMGSASSSAFCGFLNELNKGNFTAIEDFSKEIDPDIIVLFDICLDREYNGNLNEFLLKGRPERHFNKSMIFLDGISSYFEYVNKNEELKRSAGIDRRVGIWEKYLNGTRYDFNIAETKIQELNNQLSCADTEIGFTKIECEEKNVDTCISFDEIESISNFDIPDCVNDKTETRAILDNLNKYYTDETTLMTSLIDRLSLNPFSSQNRFMKAKKRLDLNLNNAQSIKVTFSKTFGTIDKTKGSLSDIMDCRVLHAKFLKFEQTVCLEFNFNVYFVLIFSVIANLFALLTSWCIFCALREDNNSLDKSVLENPYYDLPKNEIKNIMAFEEEEEMPNF